MDTMKVISVMVFILTSAAFANGDRHRVEQAWVPMRDGARLIADVHFPEGEGPWPVILVRTPYSRPGELGWDSQRLLENGYVLVYQNLRGRFESGGEATVFFTDGWGELQDGYDTVEWVAEQSWCNGKVGTWGASGPGITQYLMAGSAPPHLVCQHVGIACSDLYSQAVFQGGEYRTEMCDGWLQVHDFDLEAHRRNFAEHATYGPFWAVANLAEAATAVSAPILHWGGWYDCFAQGTLDAFELAGKYGKPKARKGQRLVIGPWPHGIANHHGALQFPHDALLPPHIDSLEWFDYWMKGKDNEAAGAAAVYYYTMGDVDDPEAPGNEWRSTDSWPPPSVSRKAYLHPDGTLKKKAAEDSGEFSYQFNPANPVRTLGGATLHLDKGGYDQRPVENRHDVVLFTSPPLRKPTEITGRLRVLLRVSSSAPDTDFTAKLTDVYPDGKSVLIQDGIRRLGFRNGFEKFERATPGEVYPIEIDLWSTSLIINKGHRLRLAISSSNYPRFQVNPNTGDPFTAEKPKGQVAKNTIHVGGDTPSCVLLPVVED
jgi:predicted acyl esterase